jgi:hypothetical protein
MLARVGLLLIASAVLLFSSPAAANTKHESPYTYEQTFGSTLRLLKVDLDLEVKEINAEWGILTFFYLSSESGERKNRGSFTFVREEEGVRVVLQIPEMPSYHEQLIIDKLKRKLELEHGEPPPPKKPKKDEDDDDDEADEDEDENAPIQPDQGPNTPKKKKSRKKKD